jgi:BlaI family transcriptional regulator, penicillinase repressor
MSRKTIPRISATEWEVMRIVWARHPATAGEIVERLAATDPSWHPKTAKTFLARLVKKGAVAYAPRGRAYVYVPRVAEADCVAAASASFLERVFGGALKPMIAHFVERHRMSPAELRELEDLLARKRKKR